MRRARNESRNASELLFYFPPGGDRFDIESDIETNGMIGRKHFPIFSII
jgi:hypothetical protein